MKFSVLILCFVLIPTILLAQGESYFRQEFAFGTGYAYSPESDIFNIPEDEGVSSAIAVNIAYRFYLRERIAVGAHVYGYTKTTSEYILSDGSDVVITDFDLYTYNFGVQGKYLFSTGTIKPYGFLVVNLATGMIESKAAFPGRNDYTGFSLGGGLGAGVALGRRFMLSVEGIASFGGADWDLTPFSNSSGDDFNPSQYGVHVNLSVFFDEIAR